jgi:hypothetical protein
MASLVEQNVRYRASHGPHYSEAQIAIYMFSACACMPAEISHEGFPRVSLLVGHGGMG